MTFKNLARVIYRRTLLFSDIKKYGFMATFKRVAMLREAWSEKGDKVLVGQDKYGNTYWQTTKTTEVHRNRWVELKGRSSQWMYDASVIPSEWHGWLHYSRDNPPTPEEQAGQTSVTPQRLKVSHQAAASGTRDQYYTPHHVFNAVHTNPDQNAYISYKRPSPQDTYRGKQNQFSRDYQKVPLDELNEERPRYL